MKPRRNIEKETKALEPQALQTQMPVAQLRRERKNLRLNINSGLCSPELLKKFEQRLAMLDEGLEALDERDSL